MTLITHTPAEAEGTVSMTYGDSSSPLQPGETSLGDVEGKTVTLNINPKTGYRVKSVTVEKPAEATITLDNTTTGWRDGIYAVPAGGLTYSDAITVAGDVTLLLPDGETLTLNKGIGLAEGATLTVQGGGTMNVNGTDSSTASTVAGTGTLVLTGGTLTAKGGDGQSLSNPDPETKGNAGGVAINGAVIVNGGILTATGGDGGSINASTLPRCNGGAGGAAISGAVTINSGTLAATGGNGGSITITSYGDDNRGGAGGAAIGGAVTINGGTLTATKGDNGTLNIRSGSPNYAGTGSAGYAGTLTLGANVKLYEGTDNTGTVLDDNDSDSRVYSGEKKANMYAYGSDVVAGHDEESNPEETATIIEAEKQTDGSWQFTMPDYSVTINIKYEEGADKTALNDAITAAKKLYDSIKDNDDYTDIANTLKTAIDTAQQVADSDEADQDNIDAAATAIITAKTNAVIGMIDKLPATVTAEDKEKIEAVRSAYNSLSDSEKTSVTNSSKLTEAETALKTAIKDKLDTAIDEAEAYHESIKDSNPEDAAALLEAINAAKAVKEKTDATQTEMENAITALAGAKETAEKAVKVNELGTAIDDADEYYNSIKEKDPDAATMLLKAINAAKEVKSNADATKEEIENITAALADAKVVAETVVAINALPTFNNVTADNKADIEAARTAYNALTTEQKNGVSAETLKKLTDAEDKLVILQTMSEVSAKTGSDVVYTGNPIQLINTPKTKLPAGYKMVYAVTAENKAPTDEKLYTTDIPTETDAGTYYVWYKVVGDENHNDVEPACVKVTIAEEKKQDEPVKPNEPDTPDTPAKTVDMYRLYNPNSGEHFYTASAGEKDFLVNVGWTYEGIGWKAPATSNTPVYRVYNPNAGDHHYTTNKAERDNLISVGWKDEGIGWYSDETEGLPIYRDRRFTYLQTVQSKCCFGST